MSTEIWRILVAFVVGMVLAVFYFGGLWVTVRCLLRTRRPVLVSLGSFLGRTVITVLVLYLVTDGHWQRLIAALLALVLVREILIRRLGQREAMAFSREEARRHGD